MACWAGDRSDASIVIRAASGATRGRADRPSGHRRCRAGRRRVEWGMGTPLLWTVGHSNRSLEDFLSLLAAHSIALLADVRRYPGSKRQPQFARESLAASLRQAGMEYRHFEPLGGRRRRQGSGSPNTAWRSESFNAYADHMLTEAFRASLEELMGVAASTPAVLLCAEAVPWRCHRQLISDALVARGCEVRHILGPNQVRPHRLTEFARVVDGQVTYPGGTLFS